MKISAEEQRTTGNALVTARCKRIGGRWPSFEARLRYGVFHCLFRILFLFTLVASGLQTLQAQAQKGRTLSPHGPLSIACENCHTSTSWKPIRPVPDFNHTETRFPLRGLHVSVSCRQCHVRLVFSNVGSKCADCHADIHRRELGGKCEECHTVRGWRVPLQAVKEHQNRFPLLGAHAVLDCASCHKEAASGRFMGLSTDCGTCHLKDYLRARPLDHQSAKLPLQCEQCHQMDSWRGAAFDHTRFTGFSLAGAHATLDCANCHAGGRFAGTPANCFSCHEKDFKGATNPNHIQASFPRDCSTCHNTTSWAGAQFDHSSRTRFALTGAHRNVRCDQCHIAGRFAGTPLDCYSCHIKAFEAAKNPDHKKGNFPTDCSACHTTEKWQGAKFDHGLTKFPLTGAHAPLDCQRCHVNNRFTSLSTDCISCHLVDFNNSRNPNHLTAGFPQDCTICHTTAQWKGAKFDHTSATRFPLTGAHTTVACADCHKNNVFKGLAANCVSCHLTEFNNSKNPNHAAAGFPQDCVLCHTTVQWKDAKFDHSRTRFPLTGAHTTIDCLRCHGNNQFSSLNPACVTCHLTDFNNSRNPNHVTAGFPQDCTICHTTAQWKGAKFDHNTATRFPLTGAHTTVACADCHKNNLFRGLPSTCVSCHLAAYNGTTNPNHVAAGFPTDCILCHTTTQWKGAVFNHSTTGFILTGAHINQTCIQCHANNRFAGTPVQCSGCHLPDYTKTANPNHTAAGFPQDCSLCHNTTSWAGAAFNHNSATKFPLTGAHVTVSCNQCHKNNVFAGLSPACVSCHLANFSSATNPNHVAAGFPQDCTICHIAKAWTPASFNHSKTRFPLSGAHVSVTCTNCHIGGKYAGTPTDCWSCHQKEYNSTTNPNHPAAGFPQNCSTCHSTITWTGATFTHSKFPIYSGAHRGKWTTCADCHTNSNNYAVFSCLNCHEHQKTTMDSKHRGVGNYVYNSANCYACHPSGRAG